MKNKILSIVKNVAPVIIFNIIFFVAWGINNPASVWISYGLIHLAYATLVISSSFNRTSGRNPFFAFTNNSISLTYCIVQFVAGLVFIILRLETVNISLYVQLPLLVIYVVLIITNIFFNDKTESNTNERQKDIDFIKNCTLQLDIVLTKQLDQSVRNKLEKAKELISTSPCKSYIEVGDIEREILGIILRINEEKDDAESSENLISRLIESINQRNLTIQTLH